ncbi:DNA cytosine methyltransferase [Hymenobacter sp. UYCo722]|uniref:DNA cytosine methyltransferase n=1 Tax=Hymenobacter sp. UYCo722 TaxID=3156335 RepID=UPI003394EF8D
MRAIDLFAGCGGLSRGLENAGFKVVAAYEHWDKAVSVYKDNFTHPIFDTDLSGDVSAKEFSRHRPQLIAGGPPCQDFSSAGARNEDGGRADLTVAYARIVTEVRPEWFIMENVERILKSQRVLKQAIQMYREAGYGLTATVLDASYCGVPQKRKRYFLIGRLGEQDDFLREMLEQGQSQDELTIRQYFTAQNLPMPSDTYYRHPRSYARRGIFSIDEPSPTIRGVNRPIPPNYQPHAGDITQNLNNVRPLTTAERALIQTFPTDFVFKATKGSIEQMLGNAVPVKLGEYVGRCIMTYAKQKAKEAKAKAKASQTSISFELA